MKTKNIKMGVAVLAAVVVLFIVGILVSREKEPVKERKVTGNMKEIYLAGGCFWGMEILMSSLPGVIDAENGYANGNSEKVPTYEDVSNGNTGYRETVKVEYNPDVIDLEALLYAYFYVIDTTVENQQGNDIGSQYQTGIYYTDDKAREIVEKAIAVEKLSGDPFKVEFGPLVNYYKAEDYHQDYLDKNPNGYCHITRPSIEEVVEKVKERQKLTAQQIQVTKNNGTERLFDNEYWDNKDRGIYVDVASGQPLFSSKDKFDSSCGWPSFSKSLDDNAVKEKSDTSHNMNRIEV